MYCTSDNYPVEELLMLCDKTQLGVVLVNNEAEIVTLNNSILQLLDCKKEDVIAESLCAKLHPDDRTEVSSAVGSIFDGKESKGQSVCRWISNSGKIMWARITVLPSTEHEKVQATAIVLVEDLAEQSETSIGLSRTDAILKFLESNHSEVVFLMDTDGTYAWISPNVSTVLGYMPENLHGRNHFNFIHSEDLSQYTSKTSEHEVSFFDEKQSYRLKHRSGQYSRVSAEHNLIYDQNGKIRYILCNARNMSQGSAPNLADHPSKVEQHNDAHVAKDHANGAKTSEIAEDHSDLPTSLKFISSYADMLQKQVKPDLQVISTRIKGQKAVVTPLDSLCMEFDMNDLIKIALKKVQKQFPDVPCIFSFPQNYTLRGQRSIMTQIWYNLILNAYQYRNPERILEIHISKDEKEDALTYNFVSNANHSTQLIADTQTMCDKCSTEELGVAGTGKGTTMLNTLISKVNGNLEQLKDSVSMHLRFFLPLNDQLKQPHLE